MSALHQYYQTVASNFRATFEALRHDANDAGLQAKISEFEAGKLERYPAGKAVELLAELQRTQTVEAAYAAASGVAETERHQGKIDHLQTAYEAYIAAAWETAQGDGAIDKATERLLLALEAVRRVVPVAGGGKQAETGGDVEAEGDAKPRKPSVNARMIDLLGKLPESAGWTARQWAVELKCHASQIVATNVWKSMRLDKDKARSERASERSRQKRRK